MDIQKDLWVHSQDFNLNKNEAKTHLINNYKNINHPIAFMGVNKIYKYYNGLLPIKEIKDFLSTLEGYTLLKQTRINKKNKVTPIFSFHYLDLVQADLIEVSSISKLNHDTNFILCVIDVFSRYLWVEPIENKKAITVCKSIHKIFQCMEHLPINFTSDLGFYFYAFGLFLNH